MIQLLFNTEQSKNFFRLLNPNGSIQADHSIET